MLCRRHNALASAAIEQKQLFIIHHTLRFDSFCERNISSFQKRCAEGTTLTATNNTLLKNVVRQHNDLIREML